MKKQTYILEEALELESGKTLDQVEICYHTKGTLNKERSNVIWVFHALTANSNPYEWWPEMFNKNFPFPIQDHFIICANILGSCYGTTGPSNTEFPFFTIRDMISCHQALADHLSIRQIKLGIAGSMGGYQLLEWSISQRNLFENICLLATSPKESTWGIAIHEAHRQALLNDPTFVDNSNGSNGLKTARGFGMILYRSYESYQKLQSESNEETVTDFKAASYIRYQSEKFEKRFSPFSYYHLLNAMDSHNVGRNKDSISEALALIKAKTLVIGISSDQLCPVEEQKELAQHIPNAQFKEIDSIYGHEGFLVEVGKVQELILEYFSS